MTHLLPILVCSGAAALVGITPSLTPLPDTGSRVGVCAMVGARGIDAPDAPGAAGDAGTAPSRSFAAFRPSIHGFGFTNNFPGSPIAIAGLELGAANSAYGICGGMSAAAADFFLAHREIPRQTKPPKRPEPLFNYLSMRQADSLEPGMPQGVRFSQWMSRPDLGVDGTRGLSLGALGHIASELSAGRGVPVGLVLVSRRAGTSARRGAIWENHQVLAYASKRVSASQIDVMIYDPNHPGNDDVRLRCTADVVGVETLPLGFPTPVLGVSVRLEPGQKRGTPVRGIFAMPYTPARPPEIKP